MQDAGTRHNIDGVIGECGGSAPLFWLSCHVLFIFFSLFNPVSIRRYCFVFVPLFFVSVLLVLCVSSLWYLLVIFFLVLLFIVLIFCFARCICFFVFFLCCDLGGLFFVLWVEIFFVFFLFVVQAVWAVVDH